MPVPRSSVRLPAEQALENRREHVGERGGAALAQLVGRVAHRVSHVEQVGEVDRRAGDDDVAVDGVDRLLQVGRESGRA